MPTSVALGSHFEAFIKQQLESGRYNNASEVVRDGLRLLEDQEQPRAAKLNALRAEIHKGVASGPATPLDLAEVRAEGQRLRVARRGQVLGLRASGHL